MRFLLSCIMIFAFTLPAYAGGNIKGTVSLAPGLAKSAAPTDTLFVFAQALRGPKMPLAIVRKEARDLPLSFTLDDSMAMMPQMKLSNFPEVKLIARISKSGIANPSKGDLEGVIARVKVGSKKAFKIIIDRKLQ